jgi:hypothetical protein
LVLLIPQRSFCFFKHIKRVRQGFGLVKRDKQACPVFVVSRFCLGFGIFLADYWQFVVKQSFAIPYLPAETDFVFFGIDNKASLFFTCELM